MLIGSEGILGVITEAWMRVQDAPRFRESAAVLFDSFEAARRRCARCRSPASTRRTAGCSTRRGGAHRARRRTARPCSCWASSPPTTSSAPGWPARSSSAPTTAAAPRAAADAATRGESEGAWRDAFLQAPYLRDTLVAAGILAETFETAITWDRFADLVDGVRERAARRSAARAP